ncbi:MAG: hypothetical protein M1823_000722 [Watsoniomyces obsoletus]|nr:MAG: hypothetical protein M1823_000722 [Watsoniomyces obsoletus]
MEHSGPAGGPSSAFESPTFSLHMSIKVDQPVGSVSISPCGRDVVLASREGLHIIDLDAPYSPPRHLVHRTPWEVPDVQWSPFASRDYWVVSISNQKALVWNLATRSPQTAIEHVLHAHTRAITDINFSAHHPDVLATCAVDSFVHCWDLRDPERPSISFGDWFAGATQVKWNRQDPHIIASSHDKFLRIWDQRMGAHPLRSIEEHNTKIYGIDWNRTRPSGIITCSLDHTIKFWDYERSEEKPERVIRTPFPVWRARHTPFGWGVLALPQRGDSDLHLYDRRLEEGAPRDAPTDPVHCFQGHQAQVKEFLWRFRGGIVDGLDQREFQLVTWGTDRDLRLHKVDERVLEQVGYHKGQPARKGLTITRRGAPYKTFRDEMEARPEKTRNQKKAPVSPQTTKPRFESALSLAMKNAAMSKAPIPLSKGWGGSLYNPQSAGMQARKRTKTTTDTIDWMKGVKIGKNEPGRQGLPLSFGSPGGGVGLRGVPRDFVSPTSRLTDSWDAPESLGDEITQAAERYPKVTFDHIDIQNRKAIISMNGPWGAEGQTVFVKVTIKFPVDYPQASNPSFELEKTTSVPPDKWDEIARGVRQISRAYASRRRTCLEPVIAYLLGESSLEQSTRWLDLEGLDGAMDDDLLAGQLSSDDEDNMELGQGVQLQDMEGSSAEVLGTAMANANVPLPKACGAAFAKDGRLICFFPPRDERFRTSMGPILSRGDRSSRAGRGFESFGRLGGSHGGRTTILSLHDDQEEGAESEDAFSSSSGSSSSSEDGIDPKLGGFRWKRVKTVARRFPKALSTDNSQLSVGQGSSSLKTIPKKPKNIVSIHRVDELIPAKKVLAKEYMILGDGPTVCEHNAHVAKRHGHNQLAQIWEIAKLVLHNQVPLERKQVSDVNGSVLVMAQKALDVRRDSGLDLEYDEQTSREKSSLRGRIRWGGHPLGQAWLMDEMFKHFEQLADIQMLAMLSCVFAEMPVGGRKPGEMNSSVKEKAFARQMPAFTEDYFPNAQMAWDYFHQPAASVSVRATPRTTHTPIASSFGGSSDSGNPPPNTPYTTGNTPPSSYRGEKLVLEPRAHSVAGSPERHHGRRSNASLTSALAASLSRGLSHSSASLKKRSSSPAMNTATTSGTLTPGGVTWGVTTFLGPSSENPIMSSAIQSESDGGEEETPKAKRPRIRVQMKNQDLFDDKEGNGTTPLLNERIAARAQGYRQVYANLLAVWGLDIARLEILKFNGLLMTETSSSDVPPYHHSDPVSTPLSSTFSTLSTIVGTKQVDDSQDTYMNRHDHEKRISKGLGFDAFCARCGTRNIRRQDLQDAEMLCYCPFCAREQQKTECFLCGEILLGLHIPCVNCGHGMHLECLKIWTQIEKCDEDEDEDDDNGHEEELGDCPTGCGCECSVETSVRSISEDGLANFQIG